MKLLKLIAILIGYLLLSGLYTFANNDYVCSTYTSSCDCTWESSRRTDGTKHCIGQKYNMTTIGNTRVGCPGSDFADLESKAKNNGGTYYNVWNAGGYAYGRTVSSTSCELVMTDTACPDVTSTKADIQGASGSAYTGTVGYNFQITSCTDKDQFGNPGSGCKSYPTNILTFAVGENQIINILDNAGNNLNMNTIDGAKSCNAVPQVYAGNNGKCNSGGCLYNDKLPPTKGVVFYNSNSCTNQDVAVTAKCLEDAGTSGCSSTIEKTNPEYISSNQNGTIGIKDNAGNTNPDIPWSVNWIDKNLPTDLNLYAGSGGQLASEYNVFMVSAKDSGAPGCSSSLGYKLEITGPQNKTIYGVISNDGNWNNGLLGLTKSGLYSFKLTVTDQAGNSTSKDFTNYLNVYPNDTDPANSSVSLITTKDSIYANGSSYYVYRINLKDKYGNPVYGKTITATQTGSNNIVTDMYNVSGQTAIIESDFSTTNENGDSLFRVKSVTPGKFTEGFSVEIPVWQNDYSNTTNKTIYLSTNQNNTFKKPFVGAGFDILTAPNKLIISTLLNTRLNITNKGFQSPPSYMIEDFTDKLTIGDPTNQELQIKQNISNLDSNPTIDIRINALTDAGATIEPLIKIFPHAYISYMLGGKQVKYKLTAQDAGDDDTIISTGGDGFVGALIVGFSQSSGKQAATNQQVNFSTLSSSQTRSSSKQTATRLIRGLSNGDTVNGVKYVEGDINIGGENLGYETLVVRNGNVTITDNLNTNGDKLGIMVIKDNTNNDNIGNIYIKPNVTKVNALMFSEGSLLSVDASGNQYPGDSINRTKDLHKQLTLVGSLFSKNTIGGAILGSSGKYILPGGKTTTSFDEAMKYDINYLRVGNTGCDKNGNGICTDKGEYINPFVLIYDSKRVLNPPKGF